MNAGDAFGVAITIVLAIWIVSGNLGRHGAGATLLSVAHPRRTKMIGISVCLAAFMAWEYLSGGTFRVPWIAPPLLLIYIAVRRVELRDGGVFANPSFYAWDEVELAGWAGDILIIRSARRFVSPRSLQVKLEGEDRERAAGIIEEKVDAPAPPSADEG